jgi:hypothetical protein
MERRRVNKGYVAENEEWRKVWIVIWENCMKNLKWILIQFFGLYLPRGKGDRKAKMLIVGICWWMVRNSVWRGRFCIDGVEGSVFPSTGLVCLTEG